MIKKAYVVGSKTSESLSPVIFNYWFKKYNINAKYSFKEIEPKNFDNQIIKILKETNVVGLNITIPFKETIINKLDKIDTHSSKIGAVNCVFKKNKNWHGTNTDWTGFLKPLNTSIKKKLIKNPIIIGAGGAAKAIIYALKYQKINEIKVFNRSYEKIKDLNKKNNIKTFKLSEINNHIKKKSIIINTTPTNVFKGIKNISLDKDSIGYDIVYRPNTTQFLSHFKKKNRIHGIDMLIFQAIPCFKRWFGVEPKIDSGLYELLYKEINK